MKSKVGEVFVLYRLLSSIALHSYTSYTVGKNLTDCAYGFKGGGQNTTEV